jgi:hypothetical protein
VGTVGLHTIVLFVTAAVPALASATQSSDASESGRVRGVVKDARGGEPMSNVEIRLLNSGVRTVTNALGRFSLEATPGDEVLHVSAVNYRTEQRAFQLLPGETQEFDVYLNSGVLRQVERVNVRVDPFEAERGDNPSALTVSGVETLNSAGVLLDDPLRAVQALPGVATNDDFNSFFVVRGAGFRRTGIYLDGILLHSPFHTAQREQNGASVTLFNADSLDSITLHSGALPVRFQDRTAAALELTTREGNSRKVRLRGAAGVSAVTIVADGPLGSGGKATWLVSSRLSYLGYLISRVSEQAANEAAVNFYDVESRLDYSLNAVHKFTFSGVHGRSSFERTQRAHTGLNELYEMDYGVSLATVAWRTLPTRALAITQRAAFLRESYDNLNRDLRPLAEGSYQEWVYQGEAGWAWNERFPLEWGWSLQRQRADSSLFRLRIAPPQADVLDRAAGVGWRKGLHAQQALGFFSGRLRLAAGGRVDSHVAVPGGVVLSPTAGLSLVPRPSTRVSLAWGQYTQFPDSSALYSIHVPLPLIAERSNSLQVGLEQRIGGRTRIRAEAYQRLDRDLLLFPLVDPRTHGTRVYTGSALPLIFNSGRGYARGVEVFLQRRSANRWSGWVGYALSHSRVRDGVTGEHFWSDFDQRHTFNAFSSWRLTPTLDLSAKYRYGSGFPVPAYIRQAPEVTTGYILSSERNEVRLRPYGRFDVRLNKSWARTRGRWNMFVEVVNVLNRRNERFESYTLQSLSTLAVRVRTQDLFPIFPAAGVSFEF